MIKGEDVTVLKVSSTLLEQVSAACQLRFNKVFLSADLTIAEQRTRVALTR